MGVIGQKINMGFYGKRQRSPAKNGQVMKPQEPMGLLFLDIFSRPNLSIADCIHHGDK